MHIDYVTATFHVDGPKLRGRSLVRHLSREHQVSVLGAVVEPDSRLLDGPNAEHCRLATELRADVAFFEGGWIHTHDFPRASTEVLLEYARSGGIVVIADLHRDNAETERDKLEALGWDWPTPRYEKGVRYLFDEGAREDGYNQRFFTSQMRITDWLEPAITGIDSLLTWGAVELDSAEGIAASAHPTTRILVQDLFADSGFPWPWASVKSHGKGFVVVIGAAITADQLIEACPDNARWISNLLALLIDRAHENKSWNGAGVNAPSRDAEATSTPDLLALLEVEESETHERKASFLSPLERGESTPQLKIQVEVVKAIAALANTEGGHLVIGQHDKGAALGLAADFAKLDRRHQDRDGFALRLAQFVDERLSRSWLSLGLRLHWLAVDEHDVAVVEVPRSPEPVWSDLAPNKGGKQNSLVVRSGPRTLNLEGPELAGWLGRRTQRASRV